jgi:hypothetical protein
MNEYLAERDQWCPVSAELMAEYNDGSHTKKWPDGSLEWRKDGLVHRDGDKPARIYWNGTLVWFKNGQIHRDGDKPARIYADGALNWFKNGQYHRDGDKPAQIGMTGYLGWYKSGLQHRVTGPAVIYSKKKREYWINGINITKEVNAWLETRKYKVPFTPEQQVEIALTFS